MATRHTCPNCQHLFQTVSDAPGQLVVCPHCRVSVRTRMPTMLATNNPRDLPVVVVDDARRQLDPLDFEDLQEDRQERRELREDRRQRRQEYRTQNAPALVGFILSVTTMVLVLGGLAFSKALPGYLFLSIVFGFPGALSGLLCSLFGCLNQRPLKPFAIAGACLGGVELLLLLPLAMLQLRPHW